MKDWSKYKAEDVKSNVDENGNRLLSIFIQDYINVFGIDICPNCNDFPVKFQKFLNKISMTKEESQFKLKAMYDGLPLEFGSPIYVTNANITDENALALLNNHPRGKELFEVLPDNVDSLIANKPTTTSDKTTSIKIFDKDLSVEEVKDLFEKAEIKTNATSINGLQKAFDKLTDEAKAVIKSLLPTE